MSSAFTQEMLVKALRDKRVIMTLFPVSAERAADAITTHHLESVIAGKHDKRVVTFAQAFELCFGERLTLKRAS